MSTSRLRATRAVATLCALTIGSSLIPTRVWADTVPRPDHPAPNRASVQRAATAHDRLDKQKKMDRSTAVAAQSQPAGDSATLESGSFFKTPVGIAVLAAFGAGVGYALYSASNDRIRSSGR